MSIYIYNSYISHYIQYVYIYNSYISHKCCIFSDFGPLTMPRMPEQVKEITDWNGCFRRKTGCFNPSEKYESQLEWLFPIYGKNKIDCSKSFNQKTIYELWVMLANKRTTVGYFTKNIRKHDIDKCLLQWENHPSMGVWMHTVRIFHVPFLYPKVYWRTNMERFPNTLLPWKT